MVSFRKQKSENLRSMSLWVLREKLISDRKVYAWKDRLYPYYLLNFIWELSSKMPKSVHTQSQLKY